MIEQFNGIIYLIIFIIHFVGYAFYAFRCLAGTKAFVDQYGMGDGAAIMTRFFGSFIVGSVLMAIYIGFVRADGLANTWAFFNLIFLQNAFAFIFWQYVESKTTHPLFSRLIRWGTCLGLYGQRALQKASSRNPENSEKIVSDPQSIVKK